MFIFIFYRRSVRSGYAFAHQEGFGRLITSGKMMRQSHQQATNFQQVKEKKKSLSTLGGLLSFYVTKTVLVGPKWFWSDQIDLGFTIMIWSQPK